MATSKAEPWGDLPRWRRFVLAPPLWFTLLLCAGVLAARKPDMFHTPQFWAEDGFFYGTGYVDGWRVLLEQYAGYYHTLPRIVSLTAAAVDPLAAPAIFVASALLLTLYVAARTQSSRSPLSFHPFTALAVVLVPDAFEVLLTIVNVQWVTAAALCLLLISRDPERPRQWVHDVLAAFLLGLTGPFSVVLLPLFVWRAAVRRTRGSTFLTLIVGVTAALQAWTIWKHPVPMPGSTVSIEYLLAVPGMRIGASLLAGAWVPPDFPFWIETVLGVAVLVAITWLGYRTGESRLERIWLAAAGVVFLISSLFRCRLVLPDLCHAGYGARYFFPIQLLVLWLLLAAAWTGGRALRRGSGALLLFILVINAPRLREGPLADQRWSDYAPRIRALEKLDVPINPGGWTIPFPGYRR